VVVTFFFFIIDRHHVAWLLPGAASSSPPASSLLLLLMPSLWDAAASMPFNDADLGMEMVNDNLLIWLSCAAVISCGTPGTPGYPGPQL
jgi:hypothetical protein